MKLEQEVQGIVQNILDDYGKNREIDRMKDFFRQPDKEVIIDLVNKLLRTCYVLLPASWYCLTGPFPQTCISGLCSYCTPV